MKNFAQKVQRFLVSEDGPTAVEYAVMLALIVIVCLSAIRLIGTNANASSAVADLEAQGLHPTRLFANTSPGSAALPGVFSLRRFVAYAFLEAGPASVRATRCPTSPADDDTVTARTTGDGNRNGVLFLRSRGHCAVRDFHAACLRTLFFASTNPSSGPGFTLRPQHPPTDLTNEH